MIFGTVIWLFHLMLSVCCVDPRAKFPVRSTPRSAGLDFFSVTAFTIKPFGTVLIPTGFAVALPPNTYGRLATPSGLAIKMCVEVGAGVIDEDYRGEIKVILHNHSDAVLSFPAHYKIAQLLVEPIIYPVVTQVNSLDSTERGSAGFGAL